MVIAPFPTHLPPDSLPGSGHGHLTNHGETERLKMTMTIYEATFPFVVGCITIFAPDDDAALGVFEAWYRPRFNHGPTEFTIGKASKRRIAQDSQLRDAAQLGNVGVAWFAAGTGWLVLPADMDGQGPLYIEQRPIIGFRLRDPSQPRQKRYAFAANEEDAAHLYAMWSDVHLGRPSVGFDLLDVDLAAPEDATSAIYDSAIPLQNACSR
jgi:hypothetical protein